MNDPYQPEERPATPVEPGLSEGTGSVNVYQSNADEAQARTGAGAVNTYDRPDTVARSGPSMLTILLLLVILALLAYAAFQLVR